MTLNREIMKLFFRTIIIIIFAIVGFSIVKRVKYFIPLRGFMLEKYYKILSGDANEIVFVGNSITEQFPLMTFFNNDKIKNRGISGQRAADILRRIDDITASKPCKIFLMIGINDIATNMPVDSIYLQTVAVIDKIKNSSPSTKLYAQSVLPTKHLSHIERIRVLNRKIESICNDKKITFIDLFQAFYKEGTLDTSLTVDGIHLNKKGYQLWKDRIEKYVNE